jgi:hypothetical protein
MHKDNLISLAIFANFFIDNEERLQRMKDSFKSFKSIKPQEWIINIRGKYKIDAGEYLQNELGKKLHLSYLNSGFGWFFVSKKISEKITASYVLFWIEDHILLAQPKILNKCIYEMNQFNVDILCYTWYIQSLMDPYKIIEPYGAGKYITARKIDSKATIKIIDKLKERKPILGIPKLDDFYVISASSIMKRDFFKKVLLSKKPYLKRRPRKTPHDFEKRSKDNFASIIRTAWPTQELFVCIDDDLGKTGYSLISRGLYPDRISRKLLLTKEDKPNQLRKRIKNIIPKILRPFVLFFVGYIYRISYTLNIFWNK